MLRTRRGTRSIGQCAAVSHGVRRASPTEFLIQELLPWAYQHYHVTQQADQTTIGGVSLGGLAAAFAGWRHADVFGNVLAQSGAFWWMPACDREDAGEQRFC